MDTWLQFPLQSANQRLKTGSRSIALLWCLYPSMHCFLYLLHRHPACLRCSTSLPSPFLSVFLSGEPFPAFIADFCFISRHFTVIHNQYQMCCWNEARLYCFLDSPSPSRSFSLMETSNVAVHLEFKLPQETLYSRLQASSLFMPPEVCWRQNKHIFSTFTVLMTTNKYMTNITVSHPLWKIQSTAWIIHSCQVLLMFYIKFNCYKADSAGSKTTKAERNEALGKNKLTCVLVVFQRCSLIWKDFHTFFHSHWRSSCILLLWSIVRTHLAAFHLLNIQRSRDATRHCRVYKTFTLFVLVCGGVSQVICPVG